MANAASTASPASATKTSNGVADSTHPFTDKAQASLHSSVDKLAESAARAEQNIRSTASDSAENMAARKAQMDAKWKASGVRKYAIENPVAAAGIAFAAGMLVTSLLRKK
ncbi:DUF883 domain-containing protein [Alteromonas sp. RKMC-009]|uniref:DUF883 domain-containing protein n=1 Tax=Alteromonas sp. RKMC-009 TaxID=2267264 RepID=UPI000E699ADE|nr:DUF883 domain-containing protein [Alteromonas sp. RKMC-009]AYA64104.1 DUF883 domain-containing protein [Alteromonas sp. RKMC-009]